jgi:hypothetical protein
MTIPLNEFFPALVNMYLFFFFRFGFLSSLVSPLLFRACFVSIFWLTWFHLYPTPTCLGLKDLVVVVAADQYVGTHRPGNGPRNLY